MSKSIILKENKILKGAMRSREQYIRENKDCISHNFSQKHGFTEHHTVFLLVRIFTKRKETEKYYPAML